MLLSERNIKVQFKVMKQIADNKGYNPQLVDEMINFIKYMGLIEQLAEIQ